MGDDMAIRSGGMYGRPESQYTIAQPTSSWGNIASNASTIGKVAGVGLKLFGNKLKYEAEQAQIGMNLSLLEEEKRYNLANYKQSIADQLASNKISFYSSGLDINKGTARNVIESNRNALIDDMQHMERNYNIQIGALQAQQKASRKAYHINQITSVLGF